MSDGIFATLEGMGVLFSGLDGLVAEVEQKAQPKFEDAANGTLADAQDNAPVLSGEMRDSGHADVDGPLQTSVTFDAPYSLFVELGHRTRSGSMVPPQHFLYPAFLARAAQLQQDLEGILN